ncbi:hypothetical protein MXB_4894 [Myxobolus squamalis]|nr:hypothetical protein MXB_4894 [Myxobolus squamalis]
MSTSLCTTSLAPTSLKVILQQKSIH